MREWSIQSVLLGLTCLLVPSLEAQIKVIDLNEATPAGDILRVVVVSSPDDKATLLTGFVRDHPTHPATPWAWRQLADHYIKLQDLARANTAADKVLESEPNDLDTAYKMLKLAENRNEPSLVKKWSAQSERSAKRISGDPCVRQPQAANECEQTQELAVQVLAYLQYLHFVDILKVTDPLQRLTALEAFLKDCPKSEYEIQARTLVFYTYSQLGETGKAYQAAIDYLKHANDNDDILLLVAERHFQEGRDREKAARYATRALEIAQSKEKPAEIDAASFERQRSANLRRAHWIIGQIASDSGSYALADQHLRAALPALKGDSQMMASALFHLGWANYKLGRLNEALKFNQMCMGIPGVHQDGARRNLQVIQAELK